MRTDGKLGNDSVYVCFVCPSDFDALAIESQTTDDDRGMRHIRCVSDRARESALSPCAVCSE